MRRETTTTRRRILHALVAAIGAVTVNIPIRAAAQRVPALESDLARAIDALLSNRESAAVIGTAYLDQFADERSFLCLQASIRERVASEGLILDERALCRCITRDFERGEIVNIEGWLLARTEARICALSAVDPHAHQ